MRFVSVSLPTFCGARHYTGESVRLHTLRVRGPAALLSSLAGGLLLALGTSIPLARGDAKPATIAPSEVKEGMKGYGLTVFKGTQPERFDVEVIGVLHQFRPGQELIVIKTPNPRLDVVKTVKGMSGSPSTSMGGSRARTRTVSRHSRSSPSPA